MKNSLNVALVILVLLSACGEKQKETPNGLKFTVVKKGNDTLAKKDQIIVFDYVMKDSKDSVWQNTFEEGVPAASMIGDSAQIANEDGMSQMFRMLSKGDSVKTTMTVSEFFKKLVKAPAPKNLDTTRTITYTIKVQDITTLESYYKQREAQIFSRDQKSIGKYLTDNKINVQTDTSGLQYIIHSNNGAVKPDVNSCVEVAYVGRFLKTGQVFDQAERVAFPLNGVIAGWKLGIPLLGKGDSATLYIPSKLAYGPQGYPGAIPPDAVLIFDVKLLEVKKEFDQASRACK